MPKSDDHVLNLVDAWLHDLLPPHEAAHVAQHCQVCPICQVALTEAQKRQAALESLPAVEASERLLRQTEERIARRGTHWSDGLLRSPAKIANSLAAAAAVLLALSSLYFASLSADPANLRVLGQTRLVAGAKTSLRVLLTDQSTQQAMVGVPIEIVLRQPDSHDVVKLAQFVTDAFGTGEPSFQLPDWTGDNFELLVTARPPGRVEMITRTVKIERSWKAMLSSDKPVYQPGQTIHLRSLTLRRPALKPVAGQALTFTVADPKGNIIFREEGVTSRFGICSADCLLADEILEGNYRLECKVGDTTSELTVEVKKYVLPKLKVAVELDRTYYEPAARVRGTVQAKYFFGRPVAAGEVTVDLQTTDAQPRSLATTSTKTDAHGNATFELTLPGTLTGRPQDGGDAQVSFQVTVRDTAGQEQSVTVPRTVAARPLRIDVMPENGALVHDQTNRVYVLTSYPDGRLAKTRVSVSGFQREFPTSALGVATVEVVPSGDKVKWTIRAIDDEGRVASREVELDCSQFDRNFLFRLDKAVYDGGDTLRIDVFGAGKEPLLLDFVKEGQTVLTQSVPMSGGRGTFHLDLPPEWFGAIEVRAYRATELGPIERKQRAIYVRPAGQLKLQVQCDQPEYRPGGEARVNMTLTDDKGQPIAGAVSLAAVDEAVFAVSSTRPGLEQAFFSAEQELLSPVYAVYPWSADLHLVGKDNERREWEQAIFSRTAVQGDDRQQLKRDLAAYLDGDTRIFDVLNRPDWEELAQDMDLEPAVLQRLRASKSNSFSAETYPQKALELDSRRQEGLGLVKLLWVCLGLVVGLSWGTYLLIKWGRLGEVLACILILGILVGLLLPASSAARHAARRTILRNDLFQLGMAVQARDHVEGTKQHTILEDGPGDSLAPRLRQWFPETLYWKPELVTDDAGRASVTIPLADAITDWRLTASAISAEGKLGASQAAIRVFQPFFVDLNLPVALTRGDEVTVPAVVYNYLDQPQTVELKLQSSPWFERLDATDETIELAPGEVKAISYRLRAIKIGQHKLQVTARAGDVADAVERAVEVTPDGELVEVVQSGVLQQPVTVETQLPAEAIEGSAQTIVKLYPSTFSQLVGGLEGIFQRPYGCFEQTSSTTYPNVLALDYLRRTGKSLPEIEAQSREYIHLGYQRLMAFEVPGGGFDWFGHPPANRALTAYGLMEFQDMARVHDIDPQLLVRTRLWLLQQQTPDGSWPAESHMLNDGLAGSVRRGGDLDLATTAYVAWAVFGGQQPSVASNRTRSYLKSHAPEAIADVNVLALVCNALLAIEPSEREQRRYLDHLVSLRRTSSDGQLVWWESADDAKTVFYGSGRSGSIETTALTTLAMINAGHDSQLVRGALAWLIAQKDAHGAWHSTQATVLALKALLAGTGQPLGGEKPRHVCIDLDGSKLKDIAISADQAEVVQQLNLTDELGSGAHRLLLSDTSGASTGYQVVQRHYVRRGAAPRDEQPLKIEVIYDRTNLSVEETVAAVATVTNQMRSVAPMVMVDIPIPAGFAIESEDLAALVNRGLIAKFQITARSAILYLRALEPSKALQLPYRLRATMPVKVSVPPGVVYEYYTPERKGESAAANLVVTE